MEIRFAFARRAAIAVVALILATLAGLPLPAHAQGSARQKDKNLMRNVGIGLGAAAAWQATKGKTTNALVLGAGALYAGKKYEDARKAQTRENDWRRADYGDYRGSGGERASYRRGGRDDDDDRYERRYVDNRSGKKGKQGKKSRRGRDCD